MRIVWASAAFVAGIASALAFGLAPGQNIPVVTFALISVALAMSASALILSRRRAAYALLCLVFLLGCWRGGVVTVDDASLFDQPASSYTVRQLDKNRDDRPLDRVRWFVVDRLSAALTEAEAGLPVALLTGDRSLLSNHTTDSFRSAGIAHLLAISGLHVSLVGGVAMALIGSMFGRRRAMYLLIPVCLVLVYAALAGFAPPVTRAAIMFCVFVLGRSLGRGSHTLAALALAAMVMIAWNPAIITSLSLQLSFTRYARNLLRRTSSRRIR